VKAQEKCFAGETGSNPDAAVLRAIELVKKATKACRFSPTCRTIPGAGGHVPDTIGLLAALIRHKAKGAVIGMIVDEEAGKRRARRDRRGATS